MMKNPFIRGGLRFYLVVIALVAGHADGRSVLYGVPLILVGIALHVWAKGCLQQNQVVTQSGPYRFVRHPFYVSTAWVDAGLVVMSGWWVLQVAAPVWWFLVYRKVMDGEERDLMALFPEAYAAYRARVPRFFPFRSPAPETGQGFSWNSKNITGGRVIPRALQLLAYPFLFYAASRWKAEGPAFLPHVSSPVISPGFLSLLAVGMLYALSREMARHLKYRRPILPEALRGGPARAAFAALILLAGLIVTRMETEADALILPLGLALIGISLLPIPWAQPSALLSECVALVGAAVFCELVWLAPLPVLYYAALHMDQRLASASAPAAPSRAWTYLHPAFSMLCLVVGLAKKIYVG